MIDGVFVYCGYSFGVLLVSFLCFVELFCFLGKDVIDVVEFDYFEC